MQSLEDLMVKCESQRRQLANSSSQIDRKKKQYSLALSRLRQKLSKNIKSNKHDIYQGFVDIVVDRKDP